MAILQFLLSFIIINFYNFCCIITVHHLSAICSDLILRLICLDMCIKFVFASVILLLFYDNDRYRTAATSGKELLMTTIPVVVFCYRRFAWNDF